MHLDSREVDDLKDVVMPVPCLGLGGPVIIDDIVAGSVDLEEPGDLVLVVCGNDCQLCGVE